MNGSVVRSAGVGAVALLGAGLLLACGGDDDRERGALAGDAVAEGRYGPDDTVPGALPGPDDVAPNGDAAGATGTGDDPVSDSPGAGTAAPSPPAASGSGGGGEAPAREPASPPPAASPAAPPAAVGGGSQAVSTDAILRATARRYEQVRSIQAGFEQEMRNPLLGQTIRSSGTLYQRQPDRFLMRFSDPEGDIIVSDGQYFWLYYPSVDARQVIRAPRGPQGLDLHAQFIGDPVRRFEATPHGREGVRGRDAHVLTLVPREPLGYRSLKVWIDAEDHLVRRFELAEENGNVRRFELRDVVVNPSLPDRLFEFTPPPGAQVIQR